MANAKSESSDENEEIPFTFTVVYDNLDEKLLDAYADHHCVACNLIFRIRFENKSGTDTKVTCVSISDDFERELEADLNVAAWSKQFITDKWELRENETKISFQVTLEGDEFELINLNMIHGQMQCNCCKGGDQNLPYCVCISRHRNPYCRYARSYLSS